MEGPNFHLCFVGGAIDNLEREKSQHLEVPMIARPVVSTQLPSAYLLPIFFSSDPSSLKWPKRHKRAFGFPHQFEFPSQASQYVLMVKFCLETAQWEDVMVSFIPTHGSTGGRPLEGSSPPPRHLP